MLPTAKHVRAVFHDDVVGCHDLLQHLQVDTPELVAEMVRHVDENAPALHTLVGHVFQAEVVREATVIAAVARRVLLRADDVGPGAVAVVEDGLFDSVAVIVEPAEGDQLGERLQAADMVAMPMADHHMVDLP